VCMLRELLDDIRFFNVLHFFVAFIALYLPKEVMRYPAFIYLFIYLSAALFVGRIAQKVTGGGDPDQHLDPR